MPIYIVRWQNLSCALVRARDEMELIDTLDQLGDPFSCRWKVYSGPLFLDFEIAAEYNYENERVEAKDIQLTGDGWEDDFQLCVTMPCTDATSEMRAQMVRFCFPHTSKVYDDYDPEAPPTEEAVREALAKDANDDGGSGVRPDRVMQQRFYQVMWGLKPKGDDAG